MKGLLFAITVFCLMSLSCSFSSQSRMLQKHDNDTVVHSKLIYIYNEFKDWEYFVESGKDTSAYSCIITSREDKWWSIELWRNINGKYTFFLGDRNENDTTAIGEMINIPERELRVPCYKDMLHEIDLCIEAASKNKSIATLSYFSSFLSYLGDIAVLTTNNLNSNFNLEKNGFYSHSDITKALRMTTFENDLDSIFRKYGQKVDYIHCQEMRMFIPKERFSASSKISKGLSIPGSIMDVEVYVSIKKIE